MSLLSCGKTPDVVRQGFISAPGFGRHSADSEAELTVGACGRGLLHRGVSEAERTETETPVQIQEFHGPGDLNTVQNP